MSVIEEIILGTVQGLTEFLPVSSSGHLVIFQTVLETDNNSADLMFDSILHLGTLIAVFIAFKDTIGKLIGAFFHSIFQIFTGKFKAKESTSEQRMIFFLILSLTPLFFILPIKDYVETAYTSIIIVGAALIITAILLFICDKTVAGKITSKDMTLRQALTVGAVQAFAIIPGISRSGSTIAAGILCGFERNFATQYSFILSIPTILAGSLLNIMDTSATGNFDYSLIPAYVAGFLAAAASGFISIKLLQLLLKTKKFFIFAIYCLTVGLFSLIYGIF